MTKDELWQAYCERNPDFREEDARIKITVKSLKAMCDQFFDAGTRHGHTTAKAATDFLRKIGI